MYLPESIQRILFLFEDRTGALGPTLAVAYTLAAAAILLAAWRTRVSGRAVSGILALMWLSMGALLLSYLNRGAFIAGILFVVEGILLLLIGVLLGRLSYRPRADAYTIVGAAFIFYALVIYPILVWALGHGYDPSAFGEYAPRTAAAFTFGILLWADRKVPWYTIIIPLVWSLCGVLVAYEVDTWEDLGLVIAGITGTVLLSIRNRRAYHRLSPSVTLRYSPDRRHED